MTGFDLRFKQLRLEKNLTQQELADDFNKKYGFTFSKSSISQYEKGKRLPEIEALKCFSQYFDVSVDYLLGTRSERNPLGLESDVDLYNQFIGMANVVFDNDDITQNDKLKLYKYVSNLLFKDL